MNTERLTRVHSLKDDLSPTRATPSLPLTERRHTEYKDFRTKPNYADD